MKPTFLSIIAQVRAKSSFVMARKTESRSSSWAIEEFKSGMIIKCST